MARGRVYSDEEKAACLAALKGNGGNVSRTANQCGVPRATLQEWIKEQAALLPNGADSIGMQSAPQPPPTTAQRVAVLLPDADKVLAERIDIILGYITDGMTKEKAEAATITQLASAFATMLEKARLLRSEATARQEFSGQVRHDIAADLAPYLLVFRSLVAPGSHEALSPDHPLQSVVSEG